MCGIFCTLCNHPSQGQLWSKLHQAISNRGPDYISEVKSEDGQLLFGASVLWLQGPKLNPQPVTSKSGEILLWNGDVFRTDLDLEEDENDAKEIARLLGQTDDEDIPKIFSRIEGPFAFVYFRSGCVWFGRDVFGRHSLLIGSEDQSFILSSVLSSDIPGVEVPAVGIYKFRLSNLSQVELFPWTEMNNQSELESNLFPHKTVIISESKLNCPVTLPKIETGTLLINPVSSVEDFQIKYEKEVEAFLSKLTSAIQVRVKKQPNFCKECMKSAVTLNKNDLHCPSQHAKIGILFSGGLDSAVIAAICDKVSFNIKVNIV